MIQPGAYSVKINGTITVRGPDDQTQTFQRSAHLEAVLAACTKLWGNGSLVKSEGEWRWKVTT
jgi:hypothetical protein